jgi:tetratricopeptide (TPR) repeat protein
MMQRTVLSLVGLAAVPFAPLAAQSAADGSRPVVQALPSPAVGELNAALRRISRNARDVDALLDAGSASLRLDDIDAAIGFYTRAREAQPGNPQASLGLARSLMRSDRPVEALEMLRDAEKAGASSQSIAVEKGLAYDLVGDNAAAQQEYARVLAGSDGSTRCSKSRISRPIARARLHWRSWGRKRKRLRSPKR